MAGLRWPAMESLQTFAGVVELLLLAACAAVLAWFVWRVLLRKLWRARRIANLRLKRMLAEKRSGGDE